MILSCGVWCFNIVRILWIVVFVVEVIILIWFILVGNGFLWVELNRFFVVKCILRVLNFCFNKFLLVGVMCLIISW